jgi:RNA polymerase sigma-70 factor (ECF subfamily)
MVSLTDEQILEGCIKNNRKAQRALFDKFAPTLLALCSRYARNRDEAQDILQDGFIKIFKNISQFGKKGSFEGWLKRIMINTAISSYRQNLKHYYHQDINEINEADIDEEESIIESEYSLDELLKLINELPDGYRIIFNMYVIEEYKHKEIAEILNIDIGTSKSQYARAKIYLQKKIEELNKKKYGALV